MHGLWSPDRGPGACVQMTCVRSYDLDLPRSQAPDHGPDDGDDNTGVYVSGLLGELGEFGYVLDRGPVL